MEKNSVGFSRSLSFKDLFVISVGQIVGAGLFSLLPAGIGLTGKSASLAFLLAAVMSLINLIPRVLIGSTVRFDGGDYSSLAFLLSRRFAGFSVIVHILERMTFALFAISFANYFLSVFDVLPAKVLSIGILTIFCIVNILGIKIAARVQTILIIILSIAIVLFCVYGVPKVDFATYFSEKPFFSDGIMGFMQAAVLLMYATGGAYMTFNLSGEAKNPTRDIPLVMIVSTLCVASVYGIMAIVASGVLPVAEVIGQPLSLVASKIFPTPLYYFFVFGGAIFALLTTINSQFATAPQVLVQAAADGWLPKRFAERNKKFNTPHWIILMFYVTSVSFIVLNINASHIANIAIFSGQTVIFALAIGMLRLSKVFPDDWKKSSYYINNTKLYIFFVFVLICSIVSAYMNLSSLSTALMIFNLLAIVFGVLYSIFGYKILKVNVQVSYESSNK